MKGTWKLVLLVAVPLVLGLLMDRLIMLGVLKQFFLLPLALSFVIVWFWVGNQFARLDINWVYSFLLGNSLSIMFPSLYIWSFMTQKSWFNNVAFWAQLYVLPVVSLSRHMTPILFPVPGTINTHYLMIFSYLLLTLAFTIGFYTVASQKKRPQTKKTQEKPQAKKPKLEKPQRTKPQTKKLQTPPKKAQKL